MSAVKRPSPGPSRRARADATRARVVRAAFALFCEHGYEGTTMRQVADAAGVAVQTVYFTFGTKSTLLSRAYDLAVGGEPLVHPTQQSWYLRMSGAPTIGEALRWMVSGVGEITRRLTPLYVVARGSAASDAEVAAVVERHESWRVEGYGGMLDVLIAKAPLRTGTTRRRALDLLLLYAGMDVYHFLVTVCGWSHGQWVDWTTAALEQQLFAPHGGTRKRARTP